jgi:Flp pilus assembly protein TadG
MRRLSARAHLTRRLREEKGAAAVFVALVMTVVLGSAAIAVDVSSEYADHHQLRNGADAAALAVALDCARGDCGSYQVTARTAVQDNLTSADATVATPTASVSATTATVTARATSTHLFGAILGQPKSAVSATSSASWIPTTRGRANFPLIISYCEYQGQVARHPLGNKSTFRINATTQLGGACAGPDGTTTLSGYAVTNPDVSTGCRTTSTLGSFVTGYADMYGSRLPPYCTNAYLGGLIGSDLLIPVWDQVSGTSVADMKYHVWGYAAFHFKGVEAWATDPALIGYFTYAAQQSDATTASTTTAPDLGARSVYLSKQG